MDWKIFYCNTFRVSKKYKMSGINFWLKKMSVKGKNQYLPILSQNVRVLGVFLKKMSGILDPRIPSFRNSALIY